MNKGAAVVLATAWHAIGGAAGAQIAVSANDGKQIRPGEEAAGRTADSIATIDLRSMPPKVLGSLAVPACMIGPPTAVAVAPTGRFALVTCSEQVAEGKNVPATTLSVVDLADPSRPRLLQTLAAGPGASGVTINRSGTLALVASTVDDAISIFSIKGQVLTPAGRVQLEARARPTDVVFAPSGKSATVVAQGAGRLVPLAVSGTRVSVAGPAVAIGSQPYGAAYSPDGRYIYNTNLGGRLAQPGAPPRSGPRIGTITALDLQTGKVAGIDVGVTPEHVTLSRDGRFAAVVVANGTGAAPDRPGAHGLLQVYRVSGTTLTKVAEGATGGWGQGALFSDDGRTLLQQIASTKQIEVWHFDGTSLTRDAAATLQFDARPGSIAAAGSR